MNNSASEQQPVPSTVKPVSRRRLLQVFGLVAAEAVLAACNASPLGKLGKTKPTEVPQAPEPKKKIDPPTPIPPKPPDVSRPTLQTESEVSTVREVTYNGFVFFIDQDELPVAYRSPDQKMTYFDIRKLNQCRKKAITEKEVQIFDSITIPKFKEAQVPSTPERPILEQLPKDTLTSQELTKLGIEIMQSDNTQLYIRKGAFLPGAQLERYASGENKLKIVLLNAPFIADIFLKDPKYSQVLPFLLNTEGAIPTLPEQTTDVMNAYRLQMKIKIEYELADSYLKKASGTGDMKEVDSDILSGKYRLYINEHISDEDLYWEMLATSLKKAPSGVYTIIPAKSEKEPECSLIVLSVGEGKKIPGSISITCDGEGNFNLYTFSEILLFGDSNPKASQSYFYSSFLKLSTGEVYKFEGPSGFTLRHEVEHDKDRERELDEYHIDEEAAKTLDGAHKQWKEKGIDTGYYYVFRLPDGRYILTEKETSPKT